MCTGFLSSRLKDGGRGDEIQRAKGLTKKLANSFNFHRFCVAYKSFLFLTFLVSTLFFSAVSSHSFFTHRDSSYPFLYDPSKQPTTQKRFFSVHHPPSGLEEPRISGEKALRARSI